MIVREVILIGNYPHDRQESMQRFAAAMQQGLREAGVSVTAIRPEPFIGKLWPSTHGLGKWLGYIDKFVLFPFRLRALARHAKNKGQTVFHICDHSNAMYGRWLREVPCLITCHDLLAIRSAIGEITKNRTGSTGKILQRWILCGLEQSQRVVCVSEATRQDLKRLIGKPDVRCTVVHNGLNHPYQKLEPKDCQAIIGTIFTRLSIAPPDQFLFHVGGLQWYKNRLGLVRIVKQIAMRNPSTPVLIIAGKPHSPEIEQEIESLGLTEMILHIRQVSNEELNALYSSAEAFLFPSLAEGFGWPIIEAQASGCPVVTSNRAPMDEVGGDAAVYIDPEDPATAAQSIQALLDEPADEKSDRIAMGLENASRFSTKSMVDAYIHEYERIVSN